MSLSRDQGDAEIASDIGKALITGRDREVPRQRRRCNPKVIVAQLPEVARPDAGVLASNDDRARDHRVGTKTPFPLRCAGLRPAGLDPAAQDLAHGNERDKGLPSGQDRGPLRMTTTPGAKPRHDVRVGENALDRHRGLPCGTDGSVEGVPFRFGDPIKNEAFRISDDASPLLVDKLVERCRLPEVQLAQVELAARENLGHAD